MKIVLMLIILANLIIADNTCGGQLKGNHLLRQFNVKTSTVDEWSCSYFLVAGSASGSTYQETKATFSWRLSNGEYVISELPIKKMRIKIDNSIKQPYIKFRWHGTHKTEKCNDINVMFGGRVFSGISYAVVVCSEKDYPINIKITNP